MDKDNEMDIIKQLKQSKEIVKNPSLFRKKKKSKKNKEFIDNQVKNVFEFQGSGLIDSEIEYAKKCYDGYKDKYNINSPSDLKLLETIVFWETLELRIKNDIKSSFDKLSKVSDSGYDVGVGLSDLLSSDAVENLKKINDLIVRLKKDLGLLYEKKKEDDYTILEKMQKKVAEWAKANVESRTYICDHCSGMNILYVNPEYWDKTAHKHPYFKGKTLFNEELIKLLIKSDNVKSKIDELKASKDVKELISDLLITPEKIAKILETSPDYANWLVTKGWVKLPNYKAIKDSIERAD
jgi:hypothetical protein